MPRFAFKAIGPTGLLVSGSLDAQSRAFALDELIASGQTPVSIRELVPSTGLTARLGGFAGGSFDYRLFLRELGILLGAGLSMERALKVLVDIAPNGRQAMRVGQILERVRAGAPLSQAFASLVREAPAHIARLLAAGEASGKLAGITAKLSASLDRAKALRDKLISGLTYPGVLVLTMAAVLWIVFTTVLPRLVPMFQDAGAALPESTSILLSVDLFLNSYGWLVSLLAVLCVVLSILALREPRVRLAADRWVLTSRLLLGIPARYEAARFCRNLQTLLEGGLSLENALALARGGSSNRWLDRTLVHVQQDVADGQHLRTALAKSKVLPSLVVEFAAVGEETGRIAPMMGEVAQILDRDVETRLERLSALVVPLATLLLGAVVAGIMAGVVSGILAVNEVAH
jgi:general secretion pathway protein F